MSTALTIAFDADDTLWHNENAFAAAEERFDEIVAEWASVEEARSALVGFQRAHVATYGYGVKSFVISMIAAACDISNNKIPAEVLRSLVDVGDELLNMPTVMIDGALDALVEVSQSYRTLIITKGDLHHQLRRVAAAGIAKYCFDVEVVADKDAETYRRILQRHRIDPASFVMIGNSVVSDIAPLLEIGARAVHVPYEFTWALEKATADPPASDRWFRINNLTELPTLIESFT